MVAGRDSRARLLSAARALVRERGIAGATTRDIAARAQVNEVTLFRHFGSKRELIAAALAEAMAPFFAAATFDGDAEDLDEALIRITAGYAVFLESGPELALRVLVETQHDDELLDAVLPWRRELIRRLRSLIEHHQERGTLRAEDPENTIRALLGPILARVALRHIVPARGAFDAPSHVRAFLDGRRAAPPDGG